MTTFELEEYLKTHSRIVDNFWDKRGHLKIA